MNQRITGFHQDAEQHWVAELQCGHTQHVRHDPPWQTRTWVVSVEGRESRIGDELNCLTCDAEAAFHDARLRGLCEEGAEDARRDAILRDPRRPWDTQGGPG